MPEILFSFMVLIGLMGIAMTVGIYMQVRDKK